MTSRSSSDYYDTRDVQATHIDEFRHEIYIINRVERPLHVLALNAIRPADDCFASFFENLNCILITKSCWYDDDISFQFNNMPKQTYMYTMLQSLHWKGPLSNNSLFGVFQGSMCCPGHCWRRSYVSSQVLPIQSCRSSNQKTTESEDGNRQVKGGMLSFVLHIR